MQVEFYPSITTTPGADWRKMIEEASELGLKEVCFFPTCLGRRGRTEAMERLLRSGIERIPLVHLRTDMGEEEITWFWDNFGTRHFNIHSPLEHPLEHDWGKYRRNILIETGSVAINGETGGWAGVCPDFSHVENYRLLRDRRYGQHLAAIGMYPRGAAHINGIGELRAGHYDRHWVENQGQLDYLRRYLGYLPEICALEMENPIREQLRMREYLREMIRRGEP